MAEKSPLYKWDELPKEVVRAGVQRSGFRGDDVLLVMNWLTPGSEVNPHSHPFEQIAYVVQGRMKFVVGDDVFEVGPGSVIRIPPNVLHWGEPIGDETCAQSRRVQTDLRGLSASGGTPGSRLQRRLTMTAFSPHLALKESVRKGSPA